MLVLCGSQFSGQDSIKYVIVQAVFIVASFTKFKCFLFTALTPRKLKSLMKNFKAFLVAMFENKTAKCI